MRLSGADTTAIRKSASQLGLPWWLGAAQSRTDVHLYLVNVFEEECIQLDIYIESRPACVVSCAYQRSSHD